ncbi:MAG: transposase, partial [Desulfonatronovibrio sp.]
MKTNVLQFNDQVQSRNICKIKRFWNSFNIPTILNRCRIRKVKGFAAKDIFHTLFSVPFLGTNFYNGVIENKDVPYGKDAVYEFLKCPTFNWRKFLLVLAVQLVAFVEKLTSKKREKVLIIDDSTLGRPRSKKVELLARVFDHCENKYLKGYRMLSVCWSDGASFLPLDFALLSSANEKNRIQGITKDLDKRSCGYKRRLEAMTKTTDLLEPMVSRILNMGVKARYVLMDSWFGMPKTIAELRKHIHVVCMVKKTPKIFYEYQGKCYTLEGIYRLLKKRPGRAKILASTIVNMKYGGQAKIVFVRDKRKKDWLALLTTDTDLPNEEVVRLYGKRWDIEVFFKMSKQHLGLEKNIQTRDFDSQIAYTSIVVDRYM